MRIKTEHVLFSLAAAALIAGCASVGPGADLDAEFAAMMKSSFRDEGIAKADRLQQDLGQSACSSAKPPSRRRWPSASRPKHWPPSSGLPVGSTSATGRPARSSPRAAAA